MSRDIAELHKRLDRELPEIERGYREGIESVESERVKLRSLVDAKVNVKAFQELEQIEEWLEGTEARDTFKFINPQKGGSNNLQKLTKQSIAE